MTTKRKNKHKKEYKGRTNKKKNSKLERYIIPINIILIIILIISISFAYMLLKEKKTNNLLKDFECKACKKAAIEVSTYNLDLIEGSNGELKVKFTNNEPNKTMWLMSLIDNENKVCGGSEQVVDCSGMFTLAKYEDKPFKLKEGESIEKVITLQPQYGLLDSMTKAGYEATTSTTSLYYVSFCSVNDVSAKKCEKDGKTFITEFFIEVMR